MTILEKQYKCMKVIMANQDLRWARRNFSPSADNCESQNVVKYLFQFWAFYLNLWFRNDSDASLKVRLHSIEN